MISKLINLSTLYVYELIFIIWSLCSFRKSKSLLETLVQYFVENIHSRSSFELNKLVFRFVFSHFIIRQKKNWFLFLHPFYYYLVTLCSVDSIFPEKELNWIIDDRISKIYLSMSFSLKRNSIFFQVYIDIQLEKYSHIQYVFQFSTFFFLFFLW